MNWNLFGVKKHSSIQQLAEQEELGEEHAVVMNFDRTVEELQGMSHNAQVTFLYRLVGALPQEVIKTLSKYVSNRLNGKDNVKRQNLSDAYGKDTSGSLSNGQS